MYTKMLLSLLLCALTMSANELQAQGCVAVRAVTGEVASGNNLLLSGDMQVGLAYRGFHSYKHFRGPHEETHRVGEGTDVRNDVNGFDVLFTYGITNRWSATADIPYTFNWRSSKYEHGNHPTTGDDVRRTTSSQGVGDIRLQFDRWMIDPDKLDANGNFTLGMGLKLPTGNYAYQDTFYYIGDEGASILKEVDQSIQLGDGGWGFSVQSQGFAQLDADNLFAYYNIFYLFTPGDTLSWEKRVDKIDPANEPAVNFSISDQFLVRGGVTYTPSSLPGTGINMGFRFEGIPVEDVFGETNGRRRPGKALSVEPGITYVTGNNIFSLNVPIAVYRNRTQSVQDLERQQIDPGPAGSPRWGDAAFSDYTIFFTYSYRIFGKAHNHDM